MSVQIQLRGKDGKLHTFEEKHITAGKRLEMMDLVPEQYPDVSSREFYEIELDFIAGLFKDERVSREAILEGIDSWNLDNFMQGVMAQLMGYDPKVILESESPETKSNNE
ncbi:phage tail assembly chaperone G [Latilactobacillus sakei]|uniref:phage tail assembly chaperone G n=1 Tax=Latilactobacillus sakei TaxID=1599 RepID=UPI0024DF6D18|nr:hypothetical protein [Latilactobacillus sakei]